MDTPSRQHQGGGTALHQRIGFVRAASRWVVEHSGLIMVLLVLWVGALCAGAWLLSHEQAKAGGARPPEQSAPRRLLDPTASALVIAAAVWLGLWYLSGKEQAAGAALGASDGWRFDQRERQRILEVRPFSRGLLWLHGAFGALGFALGVALAVNTATALGSQVELLSEGRGLLGLALLVIFVTVFGARRVRDVLFLADCDYFVGDRAEELAQAYAEEVQAEAEADREADRRKITGWAYVVFMGGFIGGLFLFARLLPEVEGTMAFQGSISGLIASVAVLYQRRLKPRRGVLWLTVALVASVGFLVFTCLAWERPAHYALLGVPWGVAVGVTATLLYLRRLRERGQRPGEREGSGTLPVEGGARPGEPR
jgi:hypothetical protein